MGELNSPLLFDFKLTKAQERRALFLHKKSIIVDMHYGGPVIYNKCLINFLRKLISTKTSLPQIINKINQIRTEMIVDGKLPEYKKLWDISGVTVGCKTVGIFDKTPYFFTFKKTLRDIELTFLEINNFNWLNKITRYEDIINTKRLNRHGFILKLENTTQLGLNFKRKIDLLYNLGVRIIQLTYNTKNNVGCGRMALKDSGITSFGKRVIRYLNEKGILIDVSHCGPRTTKEAIKYSRFPVIATHTFCKEIYDHPRGITNEEIQLLAKRGGIIGILINPSFFTTKEQISINDLLEHIDYAVKIAGVEHVGIGTDWDCSLPSVLSNFLKKTGLIGKYYDPTKKIIGYRDPRDWLNIIRGLISREYRDNEIKAIIGGNFLRVFRKIRKI
jgi:membrane dipeptidase